MVNVEREPLSPEWPVRPQARRQLLVLLLAGSALFAANARQLGLPALDDCFYARKGVEMARSGGVFTVTWNGHPTFQNPPLQIWLLARSFALLGENDFSARLPSMIMAVALLLAVYRIGCLTVGATEGVGAVALLLVSPYFLNNARRCMMEMPLALWASRAREARLRACWIERRSGSWRAMAGKSRAYVFLALGPAGRTFSTS